MYSIENDEMRSLLLRKPDGNELGGRLGEVLYELLKGRSEKEAALALGVSSNTVHIYVKSIHKIYGVASRGELLALVYSRALNSVWNWRNPNSRLLPLIRRMHH